MLIINSVISLTPIQLDKQTLSTNNKHHKGTGMHVAESYTPRNGQNPGTNNGTRWRASVCPPNNYPRNGMEIIRFCKHNAVACLNAIHVVSNLSTVCLSCCVYPNIYVFGTCLSRKGRSQRLNGFICYCLFGLLISMLLWNCCCIIAVSIHWKKARMKDNSCENRFYPCAFHFWTVLHIYANTIKNGSWWGLSKIHPTVHQQLLN